MNRRVTMLILGQLGLVACTKEPAPQAPETAAPLDIPPMPSSAAPVATAPPPPRTAQTPPPEPTATDDDDDVGPTPPPSTSRRCKTAADCAGGGYCAIPKGKTSGNCRPNVIIRGRPLVVDGTTHVAPLRSVTSDDAIALLHRAAQDEHASIAAFARTIAELMALGAPTWLLHETHVALGDEIRHTERTLDLLERFTGARPELGALPAATAPLDRDAASFFRDVLRGGAIGETLAATEAEELRLATNDDELRAFYEMIVVDESRHAALAFKTLRWLLAREPALRDVLAEERAAASFLVRPLLDAALATSPRCDRNAPCRNAGPGATLG